MEWIRWFPKTFEKLKVDYEVIEGDLKYPTKPAKKSYNVFTDVDKAVIWRLNQLKKLVVKDFKEDDVIFFADMDFPGFLLSFIHILKLKKINIKVYGFLHAGSYVPGDIYSGMETKHMEEIAVMKELDGVFVASDYHEELLAFKKIIDATDNKIHVVGVPICKKEMLKQVPEKIRKKEWKKRKYDVCYVARIDSQKPDKEFLELVKRFKNLKFVSTHKTSEKRKNLTIKKVKNRKEYYSVLAQSKFIFDCSFNTFGYSVLEAMCLGTLPIVPDMYSYVDFVPKILIYKDKVDKKIFKLGEVVIKSIKRRLDEEVYYYENTINRIVEELRK